MARQSGQLWQSQQIFNLYRLLLSFLLLFLFYSAFGPAQLGHHLPALYGPVAVLFFSLSLFSSILGYWKRVSVQRVAHFSLVLDTVCLILLMHSSGGLTSGLGMLMVVSIMGGSLLIDLRLAKLYAAGAALGLLGQEVYADISNSFNETAYSHAGFLGLALFGSSFLAEVLSYRLQQSQELAEKQQKDITKLTRLSDTVIQRMKSGIIVVSQDGLIRFINDAGWYMLDMPEKVLKKYLVNVAPELSDSLEKWRSNKAGQRADSFSFELKENHYQASFTRLDETPNSPILILIDDLARVTQQAQQMKLASLGQLTASIAHEIRNPLGALSHAAQLLAESDELGKADKRLTEIIGNNSKRLNRTIENVLQLSRRPKSQLTTLELKPWLKEQLAQLCRSHNLESTTFSLTISPAEVRIMVDPSNLEQVLANLLLNALEYADLDAGGSAISLRVGQTSMAEGVIIDIIDNGPGIPSETEKQIFEPFFTTRNSGTGLGLYIAKELCESNRASLSYIPIPTGGSCFRIKFPAVRKTK